MIQLKVVGKVTLPEEINPRTNWDRWKSVRGTAIARMLRMERPVCTWCGTEKNLTYHHIVRLAVGGKNTVDNVIPLCQKHHDLIHAKP